jgi:hypothetical protein
MEKIKMREIAGQGVCDWTSLAMGSPIPENLRKHYVLLED